MKLYFGHRTALDYWCWNDTPSRFRVHKQSNGIFAAPTHKMLHLAKTEMDRFREPLHIIVASDNEKRNINGIHCHSIGKSIPPYSFINHSAHVAISSPESCFTQIALSANLIDLIYIGCELCGTYSIDPISKELLSRKPRTRVAFLQAYLQKAEEIRGRTKAQKALAYLLDNSASPMETKLAMLLSLPSSMGGFAFPKPELNTQVALSSAKPNYPEILRCDLYWPAAKLALEYDSHQYHASNEKIVLDSTRRIKIESENIRVLSVTKQQIYNSYEFEKLVSVVAHYLGHQIRIARKDFYQRKRLLRKKLGLPG